MALTQKEISARHYKRRKENGLCPRCGQKLDRKGHYCTKCLKKHNEYEKENREFYKKLGICPECRKEKLFGDEKRCISCREKQYKRRKDQMEEQKRKYSENFKKKQKERYKERSENGICTRCGKRKAENGKKKCRICLEKNAEAHRRKRFMGMNVKEYRKENHLCFFCGNPTDRETGNICQSCWEKCKENGLKSRSDNKYWRKYNKLIFKN